MCVETVLRRADVKKCPSVFLFSDAQGRILHCMSCSLQIKEEAFVEDINNLLNSGEVPNMFPGDERVQILEAVRPDAAKQGLETPFELWGFFVQQVRLAHASVQKVIVHDFQPCALKAKQGLGTPFDLWGLLCSRCALRVLVSIE